MRTKLTVYWLHTVCSWVFTMLEAEGVGVSKRLQEHIEKRIAKAFYMCGDLDERRYQ